MRQIAVERGLSPIVDYLTAHGYSVSEIDATQKDTEDFVEGFDAVVLTGLDKDFLGFQNTKGSPPVIDAKGMSPEEIKTMLDRKLRMH